MDMFSIGSVLAEFFSENVLFDLRGLLLYKEKKHFSSDQSIKKIQNKFMKEIICSLISLDPNERKSSNEILKQYKGTLFLNYFDQLYELMKTLIRLPPDAKILCLSQEIDNILPVIVSENPTGVLLLFLQITSCIRSLKHVHCKIQAQRIILNLVKSTPVVSTYITDRLIPYLVHNLSDIDQRVRGETINTITELLEHVTRLSPSDNNIFTDYLLEIFLVIYIYFLCFF